MFSTRKYTNNWLKQDENLELFLRSLGSSSSTNEVKFYFGSDLLVNANPHSAAMMNAFHGDEVYGEGHKVDEEAMEIDMEGDAPDSLNVDACLRKHSTGDTFLVSRQDDGKLEKEEEASGKISSSPKTSANIGNAGQVPENAAGTSSEKEFSAESNENSDSCIGSSLSREQNATPSNLVYSVSSVISKSEDRDETDWSSSDCYSSGCTKDVTSFSASEVSTVDLLTEEEVANCIEGTCSSAETKTDENSSWTDQAGSDYSPKTFSQWKWENFVEDKFIQLGKRICKRCCPIDCLESFRNAYKRVKRI